jgi:hypothetical protein
MDLATEAEKHLTYALVNPQPAGPFAQVGNDQLISLKNVKLLPLPQPPLRARTDARKNPSAQRATQLRSVLARVYAVSRQNQITTDVP